MNDRLKKAIKEFNIAFSKAYDLRQAVMNILDEDYDIDANDYYDMFDDLDAWVYGLDVVTIEKAINGEV